MFCDSATEEKRTQIHSTLESAEYKVSEETKSALQTWTMADLKQMTS